MTLRLGELLERQRVAFDQAQDRVAEPERIGAVVPAERGLVQIGRQMLDGELVVRADNGAVEQAPNAFDGVGVDLAAYPFVAGPNCGKPRETHTMFNPPRCPVVRLRFPENPTKPAETIVTYSSCGL